MRIKQLQERELIIANDLTRLRELFHPDHDGWPVGYSLAHAVIPAGARSIRHHLVGSSEVYYILSGRGLMHIDDETREVGPGDALLIPPAAIQYLENTGDQDLVFLAIVEPAWQAANDVRDESA
ncbi:MAG: Cupin 2 conserved barrel domain protein [Armatimonadetes bacterium]|nr:Cupin 2 conserved barrel domain protein [Armatimonadota bacterium]